MLERFLFTAEKNTRVFVLVLFSFIITVVLGIVNLYLNQNSLFLVALASLALSYPTVTYIRQMSSKELDLTKESDLLDAHGHELLVFWALFVGITCGMFLIAVYSAPDFTYQKAFVSSISGNITYPGTFMSILTNNLIVGAFTFLLCVVVFSGLIFVLAWNASILAYYLSQLGSPQTALLNGFMLMGHGLLEIGGYILLGIAGGLLSYRVDKRLDSKQVYKGFLPNMVTLIVVGIILIVVAAALEVS